MIYKAFQGEDFYAAFAAFGNGQFFESVLNTGNVENLPAIPGAGNKMAVNQRYRRFRMFILVLHECRVSYVQMLVNMVFTCLSLNIK